VAGFSKGEGRLHGARGADLADHDDVRRLSQGIRQRDLVGFSIQPHLALGYQAALVLMHILDRVFHGNDMAVAVGVAVIQHGGQGRRFTGARTTDKNDEAPFDHRQLLNNRRQPQFPKAGYLGADAAQHQTRQAALDKGTGPEPPMLRMVNGVIGLVMLFELLMLLGRHGLPDQFPNLGFGEVTRIDLHQLPINLYGDRGLHGHEAIRRQLFNHYLQ